MTAPVNTTPAKDWPMVVEVHGELVSVENPSGDIRRCAVSPDAPFFPVIGDRVMVDEDGPRGRPVVVDIAPRRNRLARLRHDRTRRSGAGAEEHVLAANIDLAVIVVSMSQGMALMTKLQADPDKASRGLEAITRLLCPT